MQLFVNKNLKFLSNQLSHQIQLSNHLRTTTFLRNELDEISSNSSLNTSSDHKSNRLLNESNTESYLSSQYKSLEGIKDENYVELREKAVIELKKSYLKKLESMTPWRKEYEDKLSRRRIPLPFSLTGFGDSSKNTKFWVQKIQNSLEDLVNLKVKETYFDKLPASVQYFLENKPDQLDPKYQLILDRFKKEKEKLIFEIQSLGKERMNKTFNLPFNFRENLKKMYDVDKSKSEKTEILDKDYENYKKHHHLLEFVANKFEGGATNFEVSEELIAMSNAIWHRDYGSQNSKIKPSDIPCYGCGSNLHCTSSNIPGYIPYETFSELSNRKLRTTLCQRCDFLKRYNVSLNVNVEPKEYEDIIANINGKLGLILLMVDVSDFPCSLNSKILDLVGIDRRILVVVNKIDLLPKDGNNFLNRIKQTVSENLNLSKKINPKDILLISAKTGFGIDNLVSTIYQINGGKKDVYLLGCTNVGKSTLFNHLLQSELCRLRENDLIQRATTSLWPGTTLNLLKFPIRPLAAWEKEIRKKRLFIKKIKSSLDEKELRKSIKYQPEDKNLFIKMEDRISSSSQKELPFSVDSSHPFSKLIKKSTPFSDDHPAFKNANFLYDTPGTIFEDQILSLLTTEELLKTLPRKTIRPRTFTLHPFQTLFLGGLGRFDLLHSKDSILVTVFASDYLPIHIVDLEEAARFYNLYLNTDMLGVPIGNDRRIQSWPSLISKEFHIKNKRKHQTDSVVENTSICDIVLSSAGWLALTLNNGSECIFKAYTPEGRGIYLRKPSLLPRSVLFRGPKIKGTPCFEMHSSFLKELPKESNAYDEEEDFKLPVYLNRKLLNRK